MNGNAWLHELSGLIAASGGSLPGTPCEVRVRCGDSVNGVDLITGALSSGDGARSELFANEGALQSLVRGEVTLQWAFRSGAIELSGEPEPFLRLAMILERARMVDAAQGF
jgi:hypothetical protein